MDQLELVQLVLDTIEHDRRGSAAEALAAEKTVVPNDDLLRFYFEMYIANCGVSAGYRTAAWDMAVTVMFPPESEEAFDGDLVEAKARELVDWSAAADYDIAFLPVEHSLATMMKAYTRSDWAGRPEIAYGMLATARASWFAITPPEAARAFSYAFSAEDDD